MRTWTAVARPSSARWLRGRAHHRVKLAGTEGGTGLFSVNYFNTKMFLAQSPQFYKQAKVASSLERVFEVGCAYRVREARNGVAPQRVRVAGRGDGLDRQRAGPA
jgi:hypothetical protein